MNFWKGELFCERLLFVGTQRSTEQQPWAFQVVLLEPTPKLRGSIERESPLLLGELVRFVHYNKRLFTAGCCLQNDFC